MLGCLPRQRWQPTVRSEPIWTIAIRTRKALCFLLRGTRTKASFRRTNPSVSPHGSPPHPTITHSIRWKSNGFSLVAVWGKYPLLTIPTWNETWRSRKSCHACGTRRALSGGFSTRPESRVDCNTRTLFQSMPWARRMATLSMSCN